MKKQKGEAMQEIKKLFELAEKKKYESYADRYVQIARKIAMRFNIKLPQELRRKFCHNCYAFLKPGKNCQIRLSKKKISILCLKCGKRTRIGYKKTRIGKI